MASHALGYRVWVTVACLSGRKGGNAEFAMPSESRPPWKIDLPLRPFSNSLPIYLPSLPSSATLGGMLLSDELVEL